MCCLVARWAPSMCARPVAPCAVKMDEMSCEVGQRQYRLFSIIQSRDELFPDMVKHYRIRKACAQLATLHPRRPADEHRAMSSHPTLP